MVIKDILNLSDHIDVEAAEKSIRSNVRFRGPNAWILAVAIIIASVGLNVNSIPVVIGAMLISPLMGPIFGMGLGLGVNDIELMKSSGKNLLVMVSISLVVSFLYFLITPLSLSNPTELLARTSPTFYDVLIASFGGFAGILELCRKEKGTVISGVAIATALMPPLCTARYGLEEDQISIKDYTRSAKSNDIELFQEIYRRNEEQIASKDQEIRTLAEELKLLKDSSIPHSQIAKEIFSIYPSVSEISLSRGKTVNRDMTESDVLMVNLHCNQPLSEEQIEQMKGWLKTRLKIDKVILTIEC